MYGYTDNGTQINASGAERVCTDGPILYHLNCIRIIVLRVNYEFDVLLYGCIPSMHARIGSESHCSISLITLYDSNMLLLAYFCFC